MRFPMGRCFAISMAVVGWIALGGGLRGARAAEPNTRTAADLFSSTCVSYIELTQTKQLIDLVETHPLRKKIEAIPEVIQALNSPDAEKGKQLVAHLERELGMKLPAAIALASDGGIYSAFDPKFLGAAVLLRSSDAKHQEKVLNVAVALGRQIAKDQGKSDPYEVKEYRDIRAYKTKDGVIAAVGPWLVISNRPEFAKELADAYFDGNAAPLSSDKKFQTASASKPAGALAWGWIDVGTLRTLANLANLTGHKLDNPAAELLAGGVISALEKTPYLTLSLHGDAGQLKLSAAVPFEADWVPQQRSYYFGSQAKGRAPAVLPAKETLLAITAHRDLGSWWQHRDELFTDNVTAEMAKADSNLTTLFGGRDFGSEVLAAFEPQLQLIVARQTYTGQDHVPGLKLPAAALVVRLKEPEKLQRTLKVQFQSLIGFINIAGGQYKVPKLELNSTKQGDLEIISSEYLPEVDKQERPFADSHYNLSPTLVMKSGWCVFSTTKSLGMELAELTKAAAAGPSNSSTAADDNLRIALSAAPIGAALTDNKQHLISQNMLEKGHDREAAEKEVNGLLTVISWLDGLSLRTAQDGKQVKLELTLRTKTN